MYNEHEIARTAIYIKNTLKHKRRNDLEIQGDLNIWLTVYPYRQKSFNIISYYI